MWDLLHLVALEFAEDQGPQKGSVLRHYLYIYIGSSIWLLWGCSKYKSAAFTKCLKWLRGPRQEGGINQLTCRHWFLRLLVFLHLFTCSSGFPSSRSRSGQLTRARLTAVSSSCRILSNHLHVISSLLFLAHTEKWLHQHSFAGLNAHMTLENWMTRVKSAIHQCRFGRIQKQGISRASWSLHHSNIFKCLVSNKHQRTNQYKSM